MKLTSDSLAAAKGDITGFGADCLRDKADGRSDGAAALGLAPSACLQMIRMQSALIWQGSGAEHGHLRIPEPIIPRRNVLRAVRTWAICNFFLSHTPLTGQPVHRCHQGCTCLAHCVIQNDGACQHSICIVRYLRSL